MTTVVVKPSKNKTEFSEIKIGTFFISTTSDLLYLKTDDEEEICKSPKFYGNKTIPLDVDIHLNSLLEKRVELKNFHEKYQDVRIFIPRECIFTEEEKNHILSGKFFKTENDTIILSLTDMLYFDFNDCNVHNWSKITGNLEMLVAEIFYGARNEREVRTNE